MPFFKRNKPPVIIVPEKVITWEPRILGRYKFKWLKVRRRRWDWGSDWWDDDYAFSMEWLASRDGDLSEDEITEYHENILNDFSRSKRFVWDAKGHRQVRHARVLAYQQPEIFKWFYWRYISGFIERMAYMPLPMLTRFAMNYQEMKHTVLQPGFTFRRISRQVVAPREIDEFFTLTPCYTYDRDDIIETGYDYLCLDSLPGRCISSYWPRFVFFITRFCLDFQHVSFVSFWIDIIYRGFSLDMVLRRWRRFYPLLANFGYIDIYLTLCYLLLWGCRKYKLVGFSPMVWTLWNWRLIAIYTCLAISAGSWLAPFNRMFDRAVPFELEVQGATPDKEVDEGVDDIYEPPDQMYTNILTGSEVGMVGQDELSYNPQLTLTGSLLYSSWWLEANDSSWTFNYLAEREIILKRRLRPSRWISRNMGIYFPKFKQKLIRWRVPMFKKRVVIRNQFTWWLSWRQHNWVWWGQPTAPYSSWFLVYFWYYELCLGILRHAGELEEEKWPPMIRDHANAIYDWDNWVILRDEGRDIRIIYGPQLEGYID